MVYLYKERHAPFPCQKGFRLKFRSQKGGPNVTAFIFLLFLLDWRATFDLMGEEGG